jgi:hypothetical protein
MAWYVRARRPDWPIFSIRRLEPRPVPKNVNEHRSERGEVCIKTLDAESAGRPWVGEQGSRPASRRG